MHIFVPRELVNQIVNHRGRENAPQHQDSPGGGGGNGGGGGGGSMPPMARGGGGGGGGGGAMTVTTFLCHNIIIHYIHIARQDK